jgi:hypothetical protein
MHVRTCCDQPWFEIRPTARWLDILELWWRGSMHHNDRIADETVELEKVEGNDPGDAGPWTFEMRLADLNVLRAVAEGAGANQAKFERAEQAEEWLRGSVRELAYLLAHSAVTGSTLPASVNDVTSVIAEERFRQYLFWALSLSILHEKAIPYLVDVVRFFAVRERVLYPQQGIARDLFEIMANRDAATVNSEWAGTIATQLFKAFKESSVKPRTRSMRISNQQSENRNS